MLLMLLVLLLLLLVVLLLLLLLVMLLLLLVLLLVSFSRDPLYWCRLLQRYWSNLRRSDWLPMCQ